MISFQVVLSFSNDRNGVSLSNMMQTREVTQGFSVDRSTRELVYRRFNNLPQDVYYWKLPQQFLGDKVLRKFPCYGLFGVTPDDPCDMVDYLRPKHMAVIMST